MLNCRFCQTPLHDVFLDLGSAPPSNAFLDESDLQAPEIWLPLKLFTCSQCHLVQVDEVQSHDTIFNSKYAYFSSYSQSWLEHARQFVERVIKQLSLGRDSLVMEIASNDGYLLQYVKAQDIPCVGIEPTASTANVARERGIETIEQFFSTSFAQEFVESRRKADLIVANNVLAHVPDLNDFVAALKIALSPSGTVSIEFPHLMQLVMQRQFDTVYHEHFSYFSLHTVRRVLAAHSLSIWDAEELPTHGGSLRIWASHTEAHRPENLTVATLLAKESSARISQMSWYQHFQSQANRIKDDFLVFLLDCKRTQKQVVGYGAAAKGNTLLNYAGIRSDLLPYVVDASPYKQGKYLPGSRIPVVSESRIRETKPHYVVILPWNLREEISEQLAYIREWGGKFIIAIPELTKS